MDLNLTEDLAPPPSFNCSIRLDTSWEEFNSTLFVEKVNTSLNTNVSIISIRNGSVIVEYNVLGNQSV